MDKLTITDEIINWDNLLNDYEKQLRLPAYQPPGEEKELEEYLLLGREELAKLSKDERAIRAYRLQQFSFHLLRTQNRNITRLNKLRKLLHRYAAGKLVQYDKYWTYDEKLNCLTKDDEYAGKLFNVLTQFQERVDRLQDLYKNLEQMANLMRNLAFTVKENNNGG